jgi:hypothetical protein
MLCCKQFSSMGAIIRTYWVRSLQAVTLLKFQNIDTEPRVLSETDIFTEDIMNQLTLHEIPKNLYISEQRKSQRHEAIHLLAVTDRGTGQILNINGEGLSFGCLYPHTFPHVFFLDLLDAKGSHIKKVQVRKMWETHGEYQNSSGEFELVVGVEFTELTSLQEDDLNYLLENMEQPDFTEQIDYLYPNLL